MKGKILCPTGCQNPISRITKAKENLKSSRSAGSWRPFKCIFGERKKGRAQRAESPAPFALCTEKPRQGQSAAVTEQVSTTVPKSAILRFLPLAGNLLGSAFPKPCFAACAAYPRRAHAARKEVTPCERNTTHPTAAAL